MPMLTSSILKRSTKYYPNMEIVSRGLHKEWRYTYADLTERVSGLANALSRLGIGRGDIVATFAWNTHRHLHK